jgi:protein-disulfide isomerase
MMQARFIKYFLIIVFLGLTILGCQKKDSNQSDVNQNISSSILQQERQKALSLLSLYFGSELKIKDIYRGPAGSIHITAENISTKTIHNLYMLPDQQHLIDGVLYSPHMSTKKISSLHSQVSQSRALMNDNLAISKEEMRGKISSAISQNKSVNEITKLTQEAVKQRVENSSTAKRAHNDSVVSSGVPGSAVTASLPRNNTVVDRESIYNRIEKANWISSGESKKVLYVFYDFRCPACAVVHKYLDEHIENNDIQVRYLPVGALGPESLARASLSLIPKNNETRLKLMAQLARPEKIESLINIAPSKEEQQRGHQATMENFKLLLETQRVATPTFAYRTAAGAHIAVLTSKNQLAQVINNIVGL